MGGRKGRRTSGAAVQCAGGEGGQQLCAEGEEGRGGWQGRARAWHEGRMNEGRRSGLCVCGVGVCSEVREAREMALPSTTPNRQSHKQPRGSRGRPRWLCSCTLGAVDCCALCAVPAERPDRPCGRRLQRGCCLRRFSPRSVSMSRHHRVAYGRRCGPTRITLISSPSPPPRAAQRLSPGRLSCAHCRVSHAALSLVADFRSTTGCCLSSAPPFVRLVTPQRPVPPARPRSTAQHNSSRHTRTN